MNVADTRIALDRFASTGEAVKARRLIRLALEAGYVVSVQDGEEWTVKQSADRMTILAAMATTGEDRIRFRKATGERIGTAYLIYGNAHDGSELIADYTGGDEMAALVARV